ncbi:MAG: hypothetical protein MZV64_30015 [Ignavibacteriales bacterium]|nr:hypothetical protein [Ignavibacteriales bacterium]
MSAPMARPSSIVALSSGTGAGAGMTATGARPSALPSSCRTPPTGSGRRAGTSFESCGPLSGSARDAEHLAGSDDVGVLDRVLVRLVDRLPVVQVAR